MFVSAPTCSPIGVGSSGTARLEDRCGLQYGAACSLERLLVDGQLVAARVDRVSESADREIGEFVCDGVELCCQLVEFSGHGTDCSRRHRQPRAGNRLGAMSSHVSPQRVESGSDPLPTPTRTEWLSFDDDDGTVWMFDASFLLSGWTCIFGDGCQGVLDGDATEMEQGCCSYGAHFADRDDREVVKRAAKRLDASIWQFAAETKAAGGPITRNDDGAWVTRQIDDACCFLNRPDFEGGAGCALHVGALRDGERPMDWKPDVCWQVPLRLVSTTDENGFVTNTLRDWKRRDWGEGGEDFHWWCTESHTAFVAREPVYITMRDEIIELVGEVPYQWFVDAVEAEGAPAVSSHAAVVRGRSLGVALPDPVRRR